MTLFLSSNLLLLWGCSLNSFCLGTPPQGLCISSLPFPASSLPIFSAPNLWFVNCCSVWKNRSPPLLPHHLWMLSRDSLEAFHYHLPPWLWITSSGFKLPFLLAWHAAPISATMEITQCYRNIHMTCAEHIHCDGSNLSSSPDLRETWGHFR